MNPKTIVLAAMLATAAGAPIPAAAATDAGLPVRGAVAFWLIDRNGDGTIEAGEVEALRAAIFDAIDANHDGRLTRDETQALAEAARARVAERVAAAIKEGPARIAERRQQMSNALGLDKPDGISKADFVARQSPLFAAADKDGNGGVSKPEFEAVSGDLRKLMMPD